MKTLLTATVLTLTFAASAAHAAYPSGHPCLTSQYADTVYGAYSTDPVRCPPSSHTHHFGAAYREEWIEGHGSGASGLGSPSAPPAGKGGTIGGPGGRGHGGGTGGGGRGGHGGHGGHK